MLEEIARKQVAKTKWDTKHAQPKEDRKEEQVIKADDKNGRTYSKIVSVSQVILVVMLNTTLLYNVAKKRDHQTD